MLCIYLAAVGAAIVLAAIVLAFAIGLAGGVWTAVFCFVVGFGALMAFGGVRGSDGLTAKSLAGGAHD